MKRDNSIWVLKMEDFSSKVYGVLREDPTLAMKDALEKAAMMPAKRFYVNMQQAQRIVSLIDRGEEMPVKGKNKVALYKELYRRFSERRAQLMAQGVRKVSFEQLDQVILSPAPSFYEELETLKCAFYKYLRMKK